MTKEKYYQDTYEDHLWEWPTKMFSNCSIIKIHGFRMNIPNPASEYLQGIYGQDRKKPSQL